METLYIYIYEDIGYIYIIKTINPLFIYTYKDLLFFIIVIIILHEMYYIIKS